MHTEKHANKWKSFFKYFVIGTHCGEKIQAFPKSIKNNKMMHSPTIHNSQY